MTIYTSICGNGVAKPLRCLNGSAAPVVCEWQTVFGIMLNENDRWNCEHSRRTHSSSDHWLHNVCGFDRRGFQQVLITGETTVVSHQQVNIAMAILYHCTTAHYYAIHTRRFLGYDDTLCIQVSVFLHHVSTYSYSVTPGPILSVFPALIVHPELKSVHPGFPVAFIFSCDM